MLSSSEQGGGFGWFFTDLLHLSGSGTVFTCQAALTLEVQEVGQIEGSIGAKQDVVGGLRSWSTRAWIH